MLTKLALLSLAGSAAAAGRPAPQHLLGGEQPVLDGALAAASAANSLTWQAAPNARFAGVSVAQAKRLMGVRNVSAVLEGLPIERRVADDIPESFDSADQWKGAVHPIRDQGHCGSCWAFGASEALSDRFYIASGGRVDVVLSPEDLVSCDWEGNMGCNGGMPRLAWDYMEAFGLPTDECFPYGAGDGDAPKCSRTCKDGSKPQRYRVKLFSTKGYTDEKAIQTAIMEGGPVEAAFTVYQDFMAYNSGVYEHSPDAPVLGGHAVKITGWGVDNGTPYWKVANSWGTGWGLDGFFWIKRGSNECGIEGGVVSGEPSVSK
mmetsp:Transcript_9888/g.32391  ORF Transcript_9888/g.32391 Transcript_9888/m.32391 type:complete len:318 (-) Transcript_9888:139-1092(-)